MTNQFPSEEEIKRLMADRQAAFPPSTRWKYSNLAYTIAGLVVEAVSGEKWSDYVSATFSRRWACRRRAWTATTRG